MAKVKTKAVIVAKASTMSGAEPDCSAIRYPEPDYTIKLMRTLNWYSKERDRKDAYKYMKDYVKTNRKSDLQTFDRKATDKDIQITLGWIARIVQKGAVLSAEHAVQLEQHITELVHKEDRVQEDTQEPKKKNVVNIQDAIREKAMEFLVSLKAGWMISSLSERSQIFCLSSKRKKCRLRTCPMLKTGPKRNW